MSLVRRSLSWLLIGLPLLAAAPAPSPDSVTVIAAGDVAGDGPGAALTAAIVAKIPGEVLVLGDVAYNQGTLHDFMAYYDPTWGAFKARTHPATGNHEYLTPGAAGYFDYFGKQGGARGKGWYSFDLNAHWHAIALNSNYRAGVGVDAKSEQYAWLKSDLAAHPHQHVVAFWHHSPYSTGPHGNNTGMNPIWSLLYKQHVDLVLCGHDHDYERFRPLDDLGQRDDAHGIHLFIVGTGGKSHSPAMLPWSPVSVVRDDRAFGVLKLTLGADHYSWAFLPVEGQAFHDAGDAACHPLRS